MSDRAWMEQALALGALGEAATSPNPRVGCLVVADGAVVGRGFHRAAGGPHAEALALAEAGARARGATLYVNLEPCAHHGRTPPCADAIVLAGIRRLVAAIRDPNPLVDGRGFDRLRAAGVEVDVGPGAADARELNAAFLHFHQRRRPLVTLKAAMSLDGALAAAGGASRWISSEPSRRFAHRLRLRHDAVLVGANTVRRDDPRLTVRLPGTGVARRRCVLAPTLELEPGARVFRGGGTEGRPRLYAGDDVDTAAAERFAALADVVRVPRAARGLDLGAVLADLAEIGVQSVLVEGGGRTLAGFLEAGLADRMALFVAPELLGARGAVPLVDAEVVASPGRGWRFDATRQLALGGDLVLLGRVVAPAAG